MRNVVILFNLWYNYLINTTKGLKMVKLNTNLVSIYYTSIIEYKWTPQTIKNKLAYYKKKGMFEEHLALHIANKKYQLDQLTNKEDDS